MNKSRNFTSRVSIGRIGAALGMAALVVSGMSATAPASGNPQNQLQQLVDESEITKLTYCYAAATDAVGAGRLLVAKAMYAQCFTPDAVLEVYSPGVDRNGPPSLSGSPDDWADVALNEFTNGGYVSTQHLNGNVRVTVHGNTARMSTYLLATHVVDPAGAVEIANGTYEDVVVRTPQGWRISKRTLILSTYYRVESP
ncbi:nuclear transport factor 2 family protein [Chondromyces crocatus]|uniref:SnoaL-like domain-containing protein n=1 Tax=Chondromyces crocatus TaxID=52 RepID=A0A0K1EMJ5_CHOCO|nr:nuclear transport factor 2 family protein [Chondromyces crocatus]AKT42120.1 uncharacterized protein CMC5_063430 [Chondromyces crocatus]